MSYPLNIIGIITEIFPKEFMRDSDVSHNFYKQKIFILSRNQEYVIEFIKEKTSLLDVCKKGDEIEVDATLVANKWNGKNYNIIRAQKLKVISSDFTESVFFDNLYWKLYKTYNESGLRKLILKNDTTNHFFSFAEAFDKFGFVEDLFLISLFYQDTILKELVSRGVLNTGSVVDYQNTQWISCKVIDINRIIELK